jgi:hypothetical protein
VILSSQQPTGTANSNHQSSQIFLQDHINNMAPKKSGQIIRLEPEGMKLLEAYPQMAQRFKYVGWFDFFTTF